MKKPRFQIVAFVLVLSLASPKSSAEPLSIAVMSFVGVIACVASSTLSAVLCGSCGGTSGKGSSDASSSNGQGQWWSDGVTPSPGEIYSMSKPQN